jgi:hypothetical protein
MAGTPPGEYPAPDRGGWSGERWLEDLSRDDRKGVRIRDDERISAFRKFAESGRLESVEPLLPLLLNLKGKPYTLKDHFPFSPIFRTIKPKELTYKCGRQVSKSTSLASEGITFSNCAGHTTTLYITPLFEQIRKFSANYVGDFINQAPYKALWSNSSTNNSVLQRSFVNQSKMLFSFALLNADRTRGITADRCNFDEVQDLDREHIPIIQETMSYSDWNISQFTGTPKSLDNTLEIFWSRSSMAEWFIPCRSCGEWNIPSAEYHLLDMIGPYHDGISEECPGVVCHGCRSPIFPREGRWVHRVPEKRWSHAGYHVPQIIMPEHYGKAKKWELLLTKRQYMAPNVFHNEVLGESYDVGSKLLTLSELKASATLPWENRPRDPDPQVMERLGRYEKVVLCADWGGGRLVAGKEEISFTSLALLGYRSDGKIEIVWGERLLTPHDHIREARRLVELFLLFKPHMLVHDYTGAGAVRETILVQAGVPLSKIVPVVYIRSASKGPMTHVDASSVHPREHYQADKTRTLLYTTSGLKLGLITSFAYDYKSDENPGLLHDFLALIQEKVPTGVGDIYKISHQDGFHDDFAQAVNMGCAALWYLHGWPDFARLLGYASITQQAMDAALGYDGRGFDEMGGFMGQP